MTGLAFSARDLAQMRFAVSPMWQVGPSLRLLRTPAAVPAHRRWAAQVRPRLRAAGLDRGWLAELVPGSGYVPDFLNPVPPGPAPTLTQELERIAAADPDHVRRDLDRLAAQQGGLGPRAAVLHREPRAVLPRLAEEVERYWELALAPYWSRLSAVLDADISYRARQAAEHGTAHVLNDLHTSVRWDQDTLRLLRRPTALRRAGAGPGLLLLPCVFAGPSPFTRAISGEPLQLAYPARGTGTLWQRRRDTDVVQALGAVLGPVRARLLSELDSPASTTGLARRCDLAASGVHRHLTALRTAGLVSAHRAGRTVLYARTSAADTLLCAARAAGRAD